jgi:DNA helicase HerA-like ATPase
MVQQLIRFVERIAVGVCCALAMRSKSPPLRKPRSDTEGLLVGTTKLDATGQRTEVYVTKRELRRHALAIGSSGSGKSNLVLQMVDSDVANLTTVVVIDLRGDLIDRVLLRLVAKGDVEAERVCIVDLRQTDTVVGFNPLAGIGDFHVRAYHVLDAIRSRSDGWGVQIDESLRNTLVILAEAGLTLTEVEPLLTNAAFREGVLRNVSDPTALAFFERFDAMSEERRSTWVSPVLNKVTPFLAIPRLRRTLGSSDGIVLRELLDEPRRILLVALAADQLRSCSHLLGSLFIAGIQDAVMARASTPESRRNPVSLYIDEFETMASESFLSILAEARRFKLSLTLAHQNLAQLAPDLRQAVRINVATQFLFQTGSVDATELAKDLAPYAKRDEAQAMLTTQKVGEAVLVRRGKAPIRLVTPHSPDPTVDNAKVAEFKAQVLARCSRDAAEVDREIASRLDVARKWRATKTVRHGKPPAAARRKGK